MKVKFLKDGRHAHSDLQKGQFDFKVDDVVDDISEADAKSMVASDVAEIVDTPVPPTVRKKAAAKKAFTSRASRE